MGCSHQIQLELWWCQTILWTSGSNHRHIPSALCCLEGWPWALHICKFLLLPPRAERVILYLRSPWPPVPASLVNSDHEICSINNHWRRLSMMWMITQIEVGVDKKTSEIFIIQSSHHTKVEFNNCFITHFKYL